MKKRIAVVSVIVLILAVLLCLAGLGPAVSYKADVPAHYAEAILHQSGGVYSATLPLLPARVTVESYAGNRVYYTVHYFPFGTLGMSYSESDGYNIEKPLTGF